MKRKKGVKWTALTAIPTIIIVLPLYFIAIGGFESVTEIFHRPPYLFPPNPTIAYYIEAYNALSSYLKNSLIISLGVLVITLSTSVPAAFVLAKFNLFLREPINLLFAFVQVLPSTAIIIPLYLVFTKLGLINNLLSAILGISVFLIPFAVIILRAYLVGIPTGLIEAALIDGAGYFRILRSVVLPLSSPGIACVSILTFLLAWGNFIVPLAFLRERSLQPMSIGLFLFIGQYGVEWNKLMAGSMIYTIPPLIIALMAGRLIVAGLTAGAFKE